MLELHEMNDKFFLDLSSKFGDGLLDEIKTITEYCEINNICVLSDKPLGENTSESYEIIKEVWVKQWTVGDSGDSYEGLIFCKLKDSVWLMIPYSI